MCTYLSTLASRFSSLSEHEGAGSEDLFSLFAGVTVAEPVQSSCVLKRDATQEEKKKTESTVYYRIDTFHTKQTNPILP